MKARHCKSSFCYSIGANAILFEHPGDIFTLSKSVQVYPAKIHVELRALPTSGCLRLKHGKIVGKYVIHTHPQVLPKIS